MSWDQILPPPGHVEGDTFTPYIPWPMKHGLGPDTTEKCFDWDTMSEFKEIKDDVDILLLEIM